MRAADVMRRPPPTVAPGDSLERAAACMDTFEVREVPVVDGGRLIGILSRSDLGPYIGQFEWTQVRTAMTAAPETVRPEASIVAVTRVLLSGGFNGIPVVIGDVLAGMISRQDLLRFFADAWGKT